MTGQQRGCRTAALWTWFDQQQVRQKQCQRQLGIELDDRQARHEGQDHAAQHLRHGDRKIQALRKEGEQYAKCDACQQDFQSKGSTPKSTKISESRFSSPFQQLLTILAQYTIWSKIR